MTHVIQRIFPDGQPDHGDYLVEYLRIGDGNMMYWVSDEKMATRYTFRKDADAVMIKFDHRRGCVCRVLDSMERSMEKKLDSSCTI